MVPRVPAGCHEGAIWCPRMWWHHQRGLEPCPDRNDGHARTQGLTMLETRTPAMPAVKAPAKLSPVEGIKEGSRQLRGTIALDLARDTDHFSETDKQLLKFHGTYQQEDRDARKARKKDGVG